MIHALRQDAMRGVRRSCCVLWANVHVRPEGCMVSGQTGASRLSPNAGAGQISAVSSARSCSSPWPCYLTRLLGLRLRRVEVGARALAGVDVTFYPPLRKPTGRPRERSLCAVDGPMGRTTTRLPAPCSLLHERPDCCFLAQATSELECCRTAEPSTHVRLQWRWRWRCSWRRCSRASLARSQAVGAVGGRLCCWRRDSSRAKMWHTLPLTLGLEHGALAAARWRQGRDRRALAAGGRAADGRGALGQRRALR